MKKKKKTGAGPAQPGGAPKAWTKQALAFRKELDGHLQKAIDHPGSTMMIVHVFGPGDPPPGGPFVASTSGGTVISKVPKVFPASIIHILPNPPSWDLKFFNPEAFGFVIR